MSLYEKDFKFQIVLKKPLKKRNEKIYSKFLDILKKQNKNDY